MTKDIMGVIISIGFTFFIIILSEILKKVARWKDEATRKFIHVGVSHWWIIAMIVIDQWYMAIVPPILFIFLNYYSYKKSLFKSMERQGERADLGTVYFPISLLILVLLTWEGGIVTKDLTYLGAIGILVMGYGDGLAAVIGKGYGKIKYKIFNQTKSLEGSMVMVIASFLVTAIILGTYSGLSLTVIKISIIIALLAAIIEAITPFGLDNLTVPILTTFSAYLLTANDISLAIIDFTFRGALGFIISFFIATMAYRKRSLTLSGSVGAVAMGTIIYATSGIFGASLMVVFFITSSILSHYKRTSKTKVAEQFDKTGNRDILQVLSNGGVALICGVIYYVTNNPVFLVLIGVSFAVANADTWATELGVLNNRDPISLRTFKRVNKGTSGAISFIGSLAALLGAMFIGIVAVLEILILNINVEGLQAMHIFLIITLGGFGGAFIDSILGATVQGIYYSEESKKETEKKTYHGKATKLIRGLSFFNNDLVNFLSIALSNIIFLGFL